MMRRFGKKSNLPLIRYEYFEENCLLSLKIVKNFLLITYANYRNRMEF